MVKSSNGYQVMFVAETIQQQVGALLHHGENVEIMIAHDQFPPGIAQANHSECRKVAID
jgi:hypothetical protein